MLCTQSCIDFAKVQENAKIAFELKKSSEDGEGADDYDDDDDNENENENEDDEIQIL